MAGVSGGINKLETSLAAGEEEAFDFLGGIGAGLLELNEAIVAHILDRAVCRNRGQGCEEMLLVGAENLHQFVIVEGLENVSARRQYLSRNFHGTIEGDGGFVFAADGLSVRGR